MRCFVFTLVLLFSTLFTFGQGVNFRDITMEQALQEAKNEGKYVFIDFYTAWCGPCKLMEKQMFPLKEMGDYFNPKYVCLKLNAEEDGNGKQTAEKFNVKAYPTFVILDNNGELIHMFAGGVLDLTFIDKVEEAFKPSKAYGVLKKRYDAGEREPRFLASYLEALQNTFTVDNMLELVEQFYDTLSVQDKISAECLFLFDNYAPIGSDREEFLTEHKEDFRKVAGSEKVNEIFKRKYIAYYGQIIMGYNPSVVLESIEAINKRMGSLGLPANSVYQLYQTAAMVKITNEGVDDLFRLILNVKSELSQTDLDTCLYYVIIGLKEQFSNEQQKELLAYISDETTRGYVERSIK